MYIKYFLSIHYLFSENNATSDFFISTIIDIFLTLLLNDSSVFLLITHIIVTIIY